jgi:hypothetical protein
MFAKGLMVIVLTYWVINGTIVLRVIKVIEVRQVRIVLPDELHRDLKRRAIDEGMPLKELIERALDKYISENPPMQGKLPLVHVYDKGQTTKSLTGKREKTYLGERK